MVKAGNNKNCFGIEHQNRLALGLRNTLEAAKVKDVCGVGNNKPVQLLGLEDFLELANPALHIRVDIIHLI